MPCRIPSSLAPPLLIFLVFLLSLLISTNAYPVNSPQSRSCPHSTCGEQVIAYPFGLPRNLSTIPYTFCGYPGFLLICQNDTPILSLGSHNYTVTNIDYHNQTVSLVDTDVLAAGTCPRPRHNVTFMDTFFLNFTSHLNYTSLDANLTFFLDCSDGPRDHRITCFSGSSGQWSYIFTDDDFSAINGSDLVRQCQDIVVVPVLYQEVNRRNASVLSSDFGRVLNKGFQLGWSSKTSEQCDLCELSGGGCGYRMTNTSLTLACFCPYGVRDRHCDAAGTHNSKKTRLMIGVFTASAGLFLGCLFLSIYLLRCRHSCLKNVQSMVPKKNAQSVVPKKNVQNVEDLLRKYGSLVPKRYKYSEIKRMTNSFSHKLGQGGYGNVFKGNLHDGRPIAVKVLQESKGNGEEFVNEVVSIGGTSHINIVCLLGFCLEGSKRALVYEFMPNGSLEKFIYTKIPDAQIKLGWEKLYEIAVGIARGLEYLHRGCNTRIVHFDIKPHNILLDQEFRPKISDFGLAKLCPPKGSIISVVGARGTVGYIAPEVVSRKFGVASSKSDVYSYGMMVLEMVGGRKNIDARAENTSEIYFPHWIYDHLDQYNTLEACEVTSETEDIAKKMIIVGMWCIQMLPADRPSMSRVVNMLEGSISDLQIPPRP